MSHRALLTFVASTCLIGALVAPSASMALASVRANPATSTPSGNGSAVPQADQFKGPDWSLGGIGSVWMSSPVVATIDGVKAVILATLSGEIYVVNAKSGRELPGWPQWVHINSSTPTAVDSSPAVAYLDGPDRPPSIIVGAGSLWRKNQQGGLEVFYSTGKVRFVFQTKRTFNPWGTGADIYSDPVFATPAVGDITGSGQLDIVFGSYDHYIYALKPNGQLVPGFPIQRADTIWSSPTLADTSHTGRDDIFMGGDSSGLLGCVGGWIVDYRYIGSGPRLVWQRCVGETVWSSPTIGILNKTGRPAVVVGTSFYGGYKGAAMNEVFAVYANNGQNLPGWPVTAHGSTFGSPAIGRIDGQLAVVSTSCAQCLSGPAVVTAWNGSGHQIWSSVFDPKSSVTSSPVLVDLTSSDTTGDDVLVGSGNGLFVVAGNTGKVLNINGSSEPALKSGCDTPSSSAVSYVPGAPGSGWMLYFACGGPTIPATLIAYPLPVAPSASTPPAWPEWRANPDRTGIADPLSVPLTRCTTSSTDSGYRQVTADGAVFDHGGVAWCGGLNTSVLPSNVVSMATTPNGKGYWLLLSDGSVYAFGNAKWYGDLRGSSWTGGPTPPGSPVVGVAATTDGEGYFIVAANGSVYAFGDAKYRGSPGGRATDGPVVAMAVDPATGGYWLVTSRGEIYAVDAPSYGSPAGHALSSPIVAMAAAPNGSGYWLATRNGGVDAYGVPSYGSAISDHITSQVVGIAASPSGDGYWVATAGGAVFTFGNIGCFGAVSPKDHSEAITAFSAAP